MEINSFWVGEEIGLLEKLTVQSFIDNNHEFVLWVYNPHIKNLLPGKVIIKDANKIIDETQLFRYSGLGNCPTGSVGGFFELFKYTFLNKFGGWFVDMDVTCLENFKNLDSKDIVIKSNYKTKASSSIIKLPRLDNVIGKLISELKINLSSNNNKWELPIEIFSKIISQHGYSKYISKKGIFNDDNFNEIETLLKLNGSTKKPTIPDYAIHWNAQLIKSGNIFGSSNKGSPFNFNEPNSLSFYNTLLKRHKIK